MNTETFTRLCRAVDLAGWRYLLPAGKRRRVLCLDLGHGAATLALAQSCDEVLSVPLHAEDHEHLARRVRESGASNVRVCESIASAHAGSGRIDGLVAILFRCDHAGHRARYARSRLRRAVAKAGDGFVLLGLPNALGYNARPRPWGAGLRVHGARAVETLASRERNRSVRTWPVLLHDGAPFEVLHGPYRAAGGSRRRSERIKQLCLGRRGSRWLAPGFLVLADSDPGTLVVDEALRQVDAATGKRSRLRRQLAMRDKTILVTEDDERGHIVVLPRTEVALERRRHEAHVLRSAQSLAPRLRSLVPRVQGEGDFEGQAWFAIERVGGEFIDEPVADLETLSERAAAVLVDLHDQTREEVTVDAAIYDAHFGRLIAAAAGRHPDSDTEFARIDAALRQALLGHKFPFVWMHGDYKIENVGIDPQRREPVSIIDWELSEPTGFPLIDLKYLLVYNRMIRGRCPFDAVHRLVADGVGWTDWESELLDEYCVALKLTDHMRRVLRALFIVQSVGARLQYNLEDPTEREPFFQLIGSALDLLIEVNQAREEHAA
ncbi:MAG: phosphotransferase [Acidobacteria bacterium]|nr:phosphotransferase [Acidobacteriota bacterium]